MFGRCHVRRSIPVRFGDLLILWQALSGHEVNSEQNGKKKNPWLCLA